MQFKTITSDLVTTATPCLVLGIFEDGPLSSMAAQLDQAGAGWLTKLIDRGDIDGELEQTLLLQAIPGIASERILLVGCGKAENFKRFAARKAVTAAISALLKHRIPAAIWTLQQHLPQGMDTYHWVWDSVLNISDLTYRFEHLKKEAKPPKRPLTEITFWNASATKDEATAISHAQAAANGVHLAKDLANLPGNICTPSYLAEQAQALAVETSALQVKIIDEPELRNLGMGAFLGVAQGSHQPPKLIVMEYRGADPANKPVVLVGKGITFDSGGISLKPGDAMDEMKFDMSGAASVLGTIRSCLDLQLPINVVGIVPAAENMPDGKAVKPGDILTSMSGTTIEVLNTDAEGRLILCDALTYSARFEPEVVIDIATLTGACVVALGNHPSGLFANDDALVAELMAASNHSGDRLWQLPLWEEYTEQLKSRFADLANITGSRWGGAITAAAFLGHFTKKLRWAHLDIAGTAWLSGDKKGATGRPVPLLTYYLLQRCGLN
jgi:leucyl aminopeptidase